jgi:predicted lactoylglutathione lyase
MNQRRKKLFDHVVLHVKDLNASKKFYRAIIETLGHTITGEADEHFYIHELEIRQNPQTTKSMHIAFYAENPGAVKLFHESALQAGGKCIEAPCESRDQGSYTANVMDPDGNYIEAVFKGLQKNLTISY